MIRRGEWIGNSGTRQMIIDTARDDGRRPTAYTQNKGVTLRFAQDDPPGRTDALVCELCGLTPKSLNRRVLTDNIRVLCARPPHLGDVGMRRQNEAEREEDTHGPSS